PRPRWPPPGPGAGPSGPRPPCSGPPRPTGRPTRPGPPPRRPPARPKPPAAGPPRPPTRRPPPKPPSRPDPSGRREAVPGEAFGGHRVLGDLAGLAEDHRRSGGRVVARPAGVAGAGEGQPGVLRPRGQRFRRRAGAGEGVGALAVEGAEHERQLDAVARPDARRRRRPGEQVGEGGARVAGLGLGGPQRREAELPVRPDRRPQPHPTGPRTG